MHFSTGHAEVQAEGFTQTAHFTIAASGKAFKGLIDGLYSRKVEAIIRELATNARDGHIAAENVAPFHIHLPTPLKPTFWIRDYGTGMSHDLMMRRYTTMFDSTKDGMNAADVALITPDAAAWKDVTGHGITPDRPLPMIDPVNQQVGMLGLGSKSFFAYTDTCTITNWQAGEVRHYTVYMAADGIPAIAYAGAQPSDEPDGVKVEFAVKAKDFKEFETAAIRVFKGFPQAPIGLPIKVKEAIDEAPSDVGAFWRPFPKDYLPGSGFYARQGCVLYPIDLHQIDDHAVEEEENFWNGSQWTKRMKPVLSDNFAQFGELAATVVIDFPIGSLEFDLSRERLAYTDRTVMALRERWEEFRTDIDSVLAQTFEPLQTGWERFGASLDTKLTKLGKLTETSRYFEEAKAIWDAIKSSTAAKRSDRYGTAAIRSLVAVPRKEGGSNRIAYARGDTCWPRDDQPDRGRGVFIEIDSNVASLNRRIVRYLLENDLTYGFVLEPGRLTDDKFKAFGQPPIVKATELPPAPKRAKSSGGRGKGEAPPPFERIKLISKRGETYDGATSAEQYKDHLFCFINRGYVHNPDLEKYPNLSLTEVMEMHAALHYFTGRSISLINIKSNEFDKLDRWNDYPLFYGCLDGILDTIGMKDLRDLVNIINHERFSNTKYATAQARWVSAFPKAKDPLADMQRFDWRYERIASERRWFLNRFVTGSVMKPLVDQIVDQAHAAGLEVLPPMSGHKFGTAANYPYPLLPKKWEKLVKLVCAQPVDRRHAPFIYSAIKDKFGC